MMVYLVRHGDASSAKVDAERLLSDYGIRQVRNLADALTEKKIDVDRIYHSGLTRSFETAEILQKKLFSKTPLEKGEHLAPEDDPVFWKEKLDSTKENLMLVGHLPYLEILAQSMLDFSRSIVFKTSSVHCLEKSAKGWSYLWVCNPKH